MKTGCQTATKVILLHKQKSASKLSKQQNREIAWLLKQYNLASIYADSHSTEQELLALFNSTNLSVPNLHVTDQLGKIENLVYHLNHPEENHLASQSISQFWQDILPKHLGKNFAIVTSKDTHQILIASALGLNSERYHVLQKPSQGFSILNFTTPSEESAQLAAFNSATHLGTNLPQIQSGKKGLLLTLLAANTPYQQLEYITNFLQPKSLNYILSGDLNQAASVAEKLSLEQPQALQLQVLRNDFPEIWEQALLSRQTPISQEEKQILVTGLVVANETILNSLLGQVFGQKSKIIAPGSLAVVHYPPGNGLPILDTLIPCESLMLAEKKSTTKL